MCAIKDPSERCNLFLSVSSWEHGLYVKKAVVSHRGQLAFARLGVRLNGVDASERVGEHGVRVEGVR
jgi:hypothetical protein